jgi:DNA-binding response OmpR family regulator
VAQSNLILLVDHNARNLELLEDFLHKQGHQVQSMNGLDGFEGTLDDHDVGLALIDISGFDRSIWDYCQMLSDRDIPFIVISPRQVSHIREEGRQHGAKDVLIKPLAAQELASLIKSLMDHD